MLHALIWGNLIFYVIAFLITILQCIPPNLNWDPDRAAKRCINFNVAYIVTGAVNVLSDSLILLLPMIAISRLHLAPLRKCGIFAVFGTEHCKRILHFVSER